MNLMQLGNTPFSPDPTKTAVSQAAAPSNTFQKTLNVAIRETISLTVSGDGFSGTATLEHNFGYPPSFMCFWEQADGQGNIVGYFSLPFYSFKPVDGTLGYALESQISGSKLEITLKARAALTAGTVMKFKCYIFREPSI